VITFFIIPVIAFGRPSTFEMFKESGQKFKETVVSMSAISLISWLIFFPFGVVAILFVLDGLVVAGIGIRNQASSTMCYRDCRQNLYWHKTDM